MTTSPPRILPEGWLRAALAGVEAVVLTWLAVAAVSLIAYAATATSPQLGNATWTSAMDVATSAFFLAFALPISTHLGPLTLAPTFVTLLVGVLAFAASRRLDAAGLRQLWCTGAGASAGVFVIGAIAGMGLSSLPSAVAAGIVAALGNLAALPPAERALTSSQWDGALAPVRRVLERLPDWLRRAWPDAMWALWWLAGLGLMGLVTAIATAWHRVSYATGGLTDSGLDTAAIWLAQLGYLPTLITWALGWLIGAGYSIGPVRFVPGTDATGLLPAVPVLGAGPHSAWSGWISLIPAAVMLALAIWRTRRHGEASLIASMLKAVASSVVLLASLVLAATLTSGAIGNGVSARNGVWPLHMLAFGALVIVAPYLIGVAISHPDSLAWLRGVVGSARTRVGDRGHRGADSEEQAEAPRRTFGSTAAPAIKVPLQDEGDDAIPDFLRSEDDTPDLDEDYPPKS